MMTEIKLYRPSNGTEGDAFIAKWCGQCVKALPGDDDEGIPCPIFHDAMALNATHPNYPKEWRYDTAGRPVCTAFQHEDESVTPRCPDTPDMFETLTQPGE